MTILYRPHRGALADAMEEVKEFSSIKEMREYLVQDHKNAFAVSDIVISYYGYDDRIDWETFIVTVTRYYNEKYTQPQAIGFCTMKVLCESLYALADMVNQFAYETTFYGKEAVSDGGLSALENAFGVLEKAGCKVNSNGTIQRKNLFQFMDVVKKGGEG